MGKDEMEDAIATVLLGSRAGTYDERMLRALVAEVRVLGCRNIAAKLVEFKKAGVSGRFGSLMAELGFARFAAKHFACAPEFHVGDTADISFVVDGVDCLLEVVHKSSPHPFSTVFSPDPDDLPAYASGPPWKQSARKLHIALSALPLTVQPWVAREFVQQTVTWQDRERQEIACGGLADWLSGSLAEALANGRTELHYKDGVTRFELERIDAAPGYMKGFGALEAWFTIEGAFRESIGKKIAKANERLHATGAKCYLIGIVIDDAIASLGNDLLTTLLGPLVHAETLGGARTFRGVPIKCRTMIEQAAAVGRQDLLDMAQFDVNEKEVSGFQPGMYFDAPCVGGVLATYYTGTVQFIPNPFTSNSIENVRRRLPQQLTPFHVE